MFSFRKWFIEKGLCKLVKTPRRKPVNSKVRLESLEERVNPSPVVSTDLLDYAPGSTALITANNFKVGSEVVFQVSHMVSAGADGVWGTPDDVLDTVKNSGPDHQPWAVTDGVWWMINAGADNVAGTADDVIAGDLDKCENGSILTSWFVNPDDSIGATFGLSATGFNPDGVVETAMAIFTDAIKTDLRGWENIVSSGVSWANGGINAGQGLYLEGDYIPHAVSFSGLTVGSVYTFNISFNYFQASSNSGGFVDIGTYNQSVIPTLVFPVGSGTPVNDPTSMPDSGGTFYISNGGSVSGIDADVTNVTKSLAISTTEKQATVTFKALDTSATFYYGLKLAVPGEVLVPAGVTPNTNPTNGADGFTGLSLQSSVVNGPTGPAIGGGGNVQVAPGAVVQGSISGVKWSDLNGNGIKESNEPGLAGWTIQIYKDVNGDKVFGAGDTLIASTITADGSSDANKDGKIDANDLGYYNFAVIRGTYFVREVQQPGWTQTFPINNIHGPLNIDETTPLYVNQNFGNMRDKPTIDITKEHTGIVNEGAINQVLVYTFTVTNTSPVTTGSETINSLNDTILGDLLPAFKAANGGSAIIAAGATVTFTVNYTAPAANAGVSIANIVTVVGKDDQGNPVTDSASDIEFYKDLQPAITIVKTPDPTSVNEGGIGNQVVTYTYLLTNTSPAGFFDPLSAITVSDTDGVPVYVGGDDGDNLLEKGETWVYTLTATMPIQDAFTIHTNTVTATGRDDENNLATGMDTAEVAYTDYIPKSIKILKSHTGTIDEGTSGQTLVYTYTVFDDELVPTDPIKVTSLEDNIIGNILPYFIAANGGSDILQPGGSVTFTVNYTAPVANANMKITNIVVVVGQDNEGNETTATATDTAVYLDLQPAIDITKTHTGTIDEGTSGQILVYSFGVTNNSTASTDPVTVSSLSDSVLGDLMPAFMAANGGSAVIPFGGSVTFTVNYTAPVANAGVVIANTVTVIGQDDEQNPVEDSASDRVTYDDVKPMIDIQKSHTGTINEGTSGQVLVYSFTVSNMSTASTDPVTVSSLSDSVLGDLMPAFMAANGGSAVIPFGGSVTFSVSYTAPVANAGVVIANTVTVVGQDGEQNPVEDSASDRVTYDDVKPMIDIQKSHTGTINEGMSGQVLVYSFTVSNMSIASTDPVTVSYLKDSVIGDLLPAFMAANGGSAVIPFGGSVTFSVSYTAPVANAGVVIANTVVVIGQDDELNEVSDSASDGVTYQDLQPTIDITKSHIGTIKEGTSDQILIYIFKVTNTSPASTDPVTVLSLNDTVLGDLLPAFLAASGGNAVLASGTSVIFSVEYSAPVANAGVVIANTVTVIGQDDEQNPVEDSASDRVVYQDVKPMIDIQKSHTGTINEGTSGQVLVYSFTVSNMSTASTDPVTITSLNDSVLGDLMPAFMAANGGSAVIPFGGSVTFSVNYIAPVANAGVVIANTVVVIGQDDEQNPVEDSASDEATYQDVKPMIDIMKSHTGTINEGTSGQVLTYSFTVMNISTATTDPVTVSSLSDTVLGDLLGAFKAANCGSAVLPFGGSVTFTVNYTAPVANAGVVIANTVTVIGKDDELNETEDSASDRVVYQDVKPMIDIQKSHTGTINEGTSDQVLVYTFTVSNMSTASTDPVTITSLNDSVLGDLLSAFTAANGGSAVIPFGGSVTFSVNYIAPVANAGVVIANTVVVIGQDDEQNPVEDSASDSEVYKNLNPSITVTKTPDKTDVTVGSIVTYTYYVTNNSVAGVFDPLSGITLVDTDGTPSYVSGDSNMNSILEVGETWKYVLTYTTTSYGIHSNTVTASGKDNENITAVGYASAAINVSGQKEDGKTLGYYSNKNGQKDLTGSTSGKNLLSSIYNSLFAPVTGLLAKDSVNSVLVDAYGNYKPLSFFSSYANVKNYLLGATAPNMAYMLSAQLLTTEFNIQLGRIFASKSIIASAVAMPIASQNSLSINNGALNWMQVSYSGVANIQTILNAAIASLKASPNTSISGPDRVYQEGLKCLLDAMNNNQSIFLP